jgi:hypothetical protein
MLWHDGIPGNGGGVRLFVVQDQERPLVLRFWPEGEGSPISLSQDVTLTTERAIQLRESLATAIHLGLTETAPIPDD